MNVSRNRRRLIRARRYAYRHLIPGQRPPIWSYATTHLDSDSALRAVRRLASRKFAVAMRWTYEEARRMDDGLYCSLFDPCGGCASCYVGQQRYAHSGHRDDAMAAMARLERRINPNAVRFIADL